MFPVQGVVNISRIIEARSVLRVRTIDAIYRIALIDKAIRSVAVHGTKAPFMVPKTCELNGAAYASSVHVMYGWICERMMLQFTIGSQQIRTAEVTGISIENDPEVAADIINGAIPLRTARGEYPFTRLRDRI